MKTNPACEMHADIIKQLYSEKYGFKLTKPIKDESLLDMLCEEETELNPDFVEQVEELQVIIFNRLLPFKMKQSKLGLTFNLSSSDLNNMLKHLVEKSNDGLMPDNAQLFNKVLEGKLSNLVAKVFRTYQRELKRHVSQPAKKPSECHSLEEFKEKHNSMRKAAQDLFLDQIKSKVGANN